MKPTLPLIALLALGGHNAVSTGQTPQEVWRVRGTLTSNGSGCIDGNEPGNFQIIVDVNINGPGAYTPGLSRKVYFQRFRERQTSQGTEQPVCQDTGYTTGAADYKIGTDNPSPKFTVTAFDATAQRLEVSSPGLCNNTPGDIRATITPSEVTIACTSYLHRGTPKPGISFTRIR